jgi:hypothetical protein
MALQHGSAFAAKVGFSFPEIADVLNTRAEFPQLYTRQNSSSNGTSDYPTVNMFIDGYSPKFEYAASVINACKDSTTYALQCTAGPKSIYVSELGLSLAAPCGPTATVSISHPQHVSSLSVLTRPQPDTVIVGPSKYEISSAISTSTRGVDVKVGIAETCALEGTTAAVCTVTLSASAAGTSTSTQSTATNSGSAYYRFDVAITGGAEKTANPTACPAGNAAAGFNKKAVALWGLTAALGTVGVVMM